MTVMAWSTDDVQTDFLDSSFSRMNRITKAMSDDDRSIDHANSNYVILSIRSARGVSLRTKKRYSFRNPNHYSCCLSALIEHLLFG